MAPRIALVAALAATFVATQSGAFAQAAQPAATGTPGASVPASHSTSRPNRAGRHGAGGRSTSPVLIDASHVIATPNPHKTPFRNTTHNDIPPGQDVFGTQSSGGT